MGDEGIMERYMYTRNTISKKAFSSGQEKEMMSEPNLCQINGPNHTTYTNGQAFFSTGFQSVSYKVPIFLKRRGRKEESSQSREIKESMNLLTYIGVSRKNICLVS
jgi:hypothetical protein